MKSLMKSVFFMGLGMGALLMIQKYGDDAMCKMEKVVDKTMKKVDDTLEEMM